jgi:hypothetical protein
MSADGIFAVNWKNPMLLSDRHLRQAEACAVQARAWLARAVAPAAGGYGLVPPARGGGSGARLSHEQGADRLTVHIHSINGLAPDGTVLAFDEEAWPQLSAMLSAAGTLERNPPRPVRLGVLVEPADAEAAAELATTEVGEPDPAEEPARRPFVVPALRARIVPSASSSRSALMIAEYVWDGVEVEPAPDYQPPALTVAAWPAMGRTAAELRKKLRRLRELLTAAAAARQPKESLISEVVLPWLAAVATLEDGIPEVAPEVHPYGLWDTTTRVLRLFRALLSARPAALEHGIKTFVQEGKLTSGDPHFFEDVDRFLGEPYDHERLGRIFYRAQSLLQSMNEVAEYLLGAAPVVETAPVETGVYYYKEKKYKLASYGARTFELGDAWHNCFLREMAVRNPKSLLLVCDRGLLEKNPRPNAGLWMIDRYERVTANMFRVAVDATADPQKLVALFSEIGEPTLSAVSIASRGLLDLRGLSAEPDERVRIYYEE